MGRSLRPDLTSAGDVFAIVDEIARNIVNELRLTLGTGQRRYDLDLDTYERYLEARTLVGRRGLIEPTESRRTARTDHRRDPSFAPAHAALADAYSFLSMPTYSSSVTPARALELMRAAAVRAIELDPMLAEAHAAMGVVRARERDWRRSEQSFERALELDPTLTASTPATRSGPSAAGQSDEALRLLERRWRTIPSRSTWSARSRRSSSPAAATRRRSSDWSVFSRSIPSFRSSTQFLGRAMIFGGRVEEGLAVLDHDAARGRTNPTIAPMG